ncbi:E3 ubiquitin-protein ligase RNF181 [Linum grandiflorum]
MSSFDNHFYPSFYDTDASELCDYIFGDVILNFGRDENNNVVEQFNHRINQHPRDSYSIDANNNNNFSDDNTVSDHEPDDDDYYDIDFNIPMEDDDMLRPHIADDFNISMEDDDMLRPHIVVDSDDDTVSNHQPDDDEYYDFEMAADDEMLVYVQDDVVLSYTIVRPAAVPNFDGHLETVSVKELDEDLDCSVCLNAFRDEFDEESSAVKLLPCEHVFHEGCIRRWLGVKASCPLCRCQPLVSSNRGIEYEEYEEYSSDYSEEF